MAKKIKDTEIKPAIIVHENLKRALRQHVHVQEIWIDSLGHFYFTKPDDINCVSYKRSEILN